MARPTFMRGGAYDKQLEDLVQASSWKQALSLCEKRIKKGDKSDESLVTKAHVLLSWPDPNRREQGRKELVAVVYKAQPITDTNVLVSIVQFAKYRREPADAGIWERAVKARPNDEELFRTWFYTAFALGTWNVAQKASVSYKNAFPKRREPHFWYIVTNHIQAGQPIVEENERKMYAQLNYRTLAKAALAGPISGGASSIGLALEKLEDLLLLLRVYRSQGKAREALEILDNDRVGINSQIGNKEWELVRQKIDLLGQSGQWEEQWRYCQALLEDAHPDHLRDKTKPATFTFGPVGDDWKVWSGLIAAASHIRTEENATLTERLIKSYGNCSRNARLALLKFYSSDLVEGIHTQAELLAACSQHFNDYATKLVCFFDLNSYVVCLDPLNQVELLKLSAHEARRLKPHRNDPESKAIQWLTSEINVLKLDYFLVVSKYPNCHDQSLLDAFVCNCLRLYKVSLVLGSKLPVSERRPGDDAAILAVMAMLHMANLREDNAVLRAVVILECLLANSKHNYDALLMQVRLNLLLGTASLAMERYSQLCIKNMQHATLSWILFTRISTLHPYSLSPLSKSKGLFATRDPSETLTAALDWHRSAERINAGSIEKMLRDGQYNMLFDALELGYSIGNGFAKLISLVEWSRSHRFGGVSNEKNHADLINFWTGDAVDNRDTAVFPSCESPDQDPHTRSLIDSWFTTKQLNGRWLSRQLEMAWFWECIHNRTTIDTRATFSMINRESDQSNNGTAIEEKERQTIEILEHLCSLSSSSEQLEDNKRMMLALFEILDETIEGFIKALDGFAVASGETFTHLGAGLMTPNWKYYHWFFVILDICQFCKVSMVHLLVAIREHPFVDPESLLHRCERLRVLIWKITSQTELNVSHQQQLLRNGNAAQELTRAIRWGLHEEQDTVGKALESLIDQRSLKRMAADMCESWTEALDGILKANNHVSINN